jgi:hypothetical protein
MSQTRDDLQTGGAGSGGVRWQPPLQTLLSWVKELCGFGFEPHESWCQAVYISEPPGCFKRTETLPGRPLDRNCGVGAWPSAPCLHAPHVFKEAFD